MPRLSPRTFLILLLLALLNVALVAFYAVYSNTYDEARIADEELIIENKNWRNMTSASKTQNYAYDLNNWESFLEAVQGYPVTGTQDFNYEEWKQYFFGTGRELRKRCITDLSQYALDEFKKMETQHDNLVAQWISENGSNSSTSANEKPKFSLFSCRAKVRTEQRNRICLGVNVCLRKGGQFHFFAPPLRMMNRTYVDADSYLRVGIGFGGGTIFNMPVIDGPVPPEQVFQHDSELVAFSAPKNTDNNFHKLFEDYLTLYGILKDGGAMIDEYNNTAKRNSPDLTLALIDGAADKDLVEHGFASRLLTLAQIGHATLPYTCFKRFAIGGGGRTRVRYNIPQRTGFADHPNEGCEGEEMVGQRDAVLKGFMLPQGDDMLYNIFKVSGGNFESLTVEDLITRLSTFSVVFGNRGPSYGRHVDGVPELFAKLQTLFSFLRANGTVMPNITTEEVLFQGKTERQQAQMMRSVDMYIAPMGSTVPNAMYMGTTSSTLMVMPFGALTEWWSYFSPMRSFPQPFYIYSNIRIPDDAAVDANIRAQVLAYPKSGWTPSAFSAAVGSWFGYFQKKHFSIDEYDMFLQSFFKSIHATYFGRFVYLKELCQSKAHSSNIYCNAKILQHMASIVGALAAQIN